MSDVATRYFAKVARTETCWLWTGATDACGYGIVRGLDGRVIRAHRLAWQLAVGPIPTDRCVLHHCDNPRCQNPAHLFLGTRADNAHDRDAKGRQVTLGGDRHWSRLHPERVTRGVSHWNRLHPERMARGNRHGSQTHPECVRRGERHPHAKLSAENVIHIRELAQTIAGKTLAIQFGVAYRTIRDIITGKTWQGVSCT